VFIDGFVHLLVRLMERAREQGVGVPAMVSTDYINTISPGTVLR
jgi:pyruvate dehydrogenase E1 component